MKAKLLFILIGILMSVSSQAMIVCGTVGIGIFNVNWCMGTGDDCEGKTTFGIDTDGDGTLDGKCCFWSPSISAISFEDLTFTTGTNGYVAIKSIRLVVNIENIKDKKNLENYLNSSKNLNKTIRDCNKILIKNKVTPQKVK